MKTNLFKKAVLPLALIILTTSIACANSKEVNKNSLKTNVEKEEIYSEKKMFSDISDHWGKKEILWSHSSGISNGVTEDEFAPDNELTRAMFISMIYRMAGSPKTDYEVEFKDVQPEHYYYDAVRWAVKNNVITGITPDYFGGDENITREDAITMLYRKENIDFKIEPKVWEAYIDKNEISKYAEKAINWAIKEKVMKGYNLNVMKPKNSMTRAQAVVVLMRSNDLHKEVNPFNISPENVYKLSLKNGNTGIETRIKDKERIKDLISKINSFEGTEDRNYSPMSGFTYALRVELKDSNRTIGYSLQDNSIIIEDKKYITNKKGYTYDDWHKALEFIRDISYHDDFVSEGKVVPFEYKNIKSINVSYNPMDVENAGKTVHIRDANEIKDLVEKINRKDLKNVNKMTDNEHEGGYRVQMVFKMENDEIYYFSVFGSSKEDNGLIRRGGYSFYLASPMSFDF